MLNGKPSLRTERAELTVDNLQKHQLDSSKFADDYFHTGLIQEERSSAAERALHQALFDDTATDEESLQTVPRDPAPNIEPSLNPLKLYIGTHPLSGMPLNRFLAVSPTQDPHPWLAKSTLKESGISAGDLEAVSVRQLATQMVVDNEIGTRLSQDSMGTPRPSSDTLSVTQMREMRAVRMNRARVHRRVGLRRRRQDVTKPARVPVVLHQQNNETGS